ncbi:uncharacterized protein LOC131010706 [Salvia miltiorrhiza]|uniref:uncharacterized protein LOC131010706 n=1 Tax=Salvia miltiorrhiza TaxID=226208 RepID=UPI0025AC9D76|nr:uncharacterized protein LOC131010706 [Salvia miltiorrhiza]XP_057794354.1 uncharacterized protein LOC131010706 [Salvia miltiorrhiza]
MRQFRELCLVSLELLHLSIKELCLEFLELCTHQLRSFAWSCWSLAPIDQGVLLGVFFWRAFLGALELLHPSIKKLCLEFLELCTHQQEVLLGAVGALHPSIKELCLEFLELCTHQSRSFAWSCWSFAPINQGVLLGVFFLELCTHQSRSFSWSFGAFAPINQGALLGVFGALHPSIKELFLELWSFCTHQSRSFSWSFGAFAPINQGVLLGYNFLLGSVDILLLRGLSRLLQHGSGDV